MIFLSRILVELTQLSLSETFYYSVGERLANLSEQPHKVERSQYIYISLWFTPIYSNPSDD